MAYVPLPENYKNDVLDTSTNTEVRYEMTNHGSNIISLEDVTSYSQVGDTFDASVLNTMTGTINDIGENVDDLLAGKVNIDTTAASGTIDGDLYAAITALGWQSYVIV